MQPLVALNVGLVSAIGLNAEESCAAVRCGINRFQETWFVDRNGERLVGSEVRLEEAWHGIAKLVKLAERAIRDCLEPEAAPSVTDIPILVCVAETDRPGRLTGLDHILLEGLEDAFGSSLHPDSRLISAGRVGGVVGLLHARRLLAGAQTSHVLLIGVDSFLTAGTLAAYDAADRLLRKDNSNGFIPGEAAGAVLLSPATLVAAAPLVLRGLGFAREPASLTSNKPLRGDGLVASITAALGDAGVRLEDCDYRIADVNGEQYRFKEAGLAVTRLLRTRKVLFGLWHSADCIGEVGAATLPAMLAMLFHGARKDYLPGPLFLGHLGNDDDKRAAFVAEASIPQTLSQVSAAEAAFRSRRQELHHGE